MKMLRVDWEDMEGNAAGLGLDDILPGISNEQEAIEAAEYYYFLSRGENCDGKHRAVISEE